MRKSAMKFGRWRMRWHSDNLVPLSALVPLNISCVYGFFLT
jgi:hypothetical protein